MSQDIDNIVGLDAHRQTLNKFQNPVLLPSSKYYPRTLSEAFYLCEFLYYLIPSYRQTQKRTVRYFITDIEYNDIDLKVKNVLDSVLKNVLDIFATMTTIGDHWGCYGNAFVRVHKPYDRYFVKKNKTKMPKFYTYTVFEPYEERIKYNPESMTYTMPDPENNFKTDVDFEFIDRSSDDIKKLKLIVDNPKYFRINYNSLSDSSKYIFKFPPEVTNAIRQNNIHVINTTPRSMLQAIGKEQDFLFNDGEIFHFKGPTINGLSKHGWGLPELIANFRQICLILSYMKADEAIAMDYMLPLRVFSMPAQGGGVGDNLSYIDSYEFKANVQSMIANRRQDPFATHVVPFPLQYGEYLGTGRQYVPKDILDQALMSLNTGAGFTTDLFSASANINIIPTALRIFQNTYYFIFNGFNKLLKWTTEHVQTFIGSDRTEVDLQMPKYADNLETLNIKMNLGQNGQLPYSAMFEPLGIKDPVNAVVQRHKEEIQIQEEKQKLDEESQSKAQAKEILMAEAEEANGGGGAPEGGGEGGSGMLEMKRRAMDTAQQLLQMPIGQRRQQMKELESDEVMYSLVKQYMQEQRNDMRSQGMQAMKDQNGVV